ncbi:MAG TPA: ATP-binding protein, partial [Polyangiales bacterium]
MAERETTQGLLDALIVALDDAHPQQGLELALTVLRERGLAAPDGQVWLELTRGARTLRLALASGAEAPDAPRASLIGHLMSVALTRAVEYEERERLEERNTLLSHAAFEGLAIHVDGVPVEANTRMAEMLRCERHELLAPSALARFMAPEDMPTVMARIRERLEAVFIVTLVRKDGTRFRAEFRSKQGQLGERPVRVVALRDVTDQERTAALLRESERRLRQILEETFDNVVIVRDGVVLHVGGKQAPFFGVSAEELLGRSVIDYIAPHARADMIRRFQDQSAGTYETTAISPAGEQIPVQVVSVISTLDGEPVRVAGLRDLREERRLEAERQRLARHVERSQRLESLGVLASGLAHDFNNLLVGVLGSAELLLPRLSAPEDRVLAENILTAGERAAGLTRQMLVYAGRREIRAPEPVDLGALWLELRGLLDAALSKRAVIELTLAPDSVVLGERSTLMQVLMNLLTNASDALEGGPGRIHVSTRHAQQLDARWAEALGSNASAERWIVVEVRDSGAGMDEATRARIFEPFFTTKSKGHGLGLGACLGIVASHGGRMLVESAPGKGSTFALALPATHMRPTTSTPSEPAPRPCRVLIIDD